MKKNTTMVEPEYVIPEHVLEIVEAIKKDKSLEKSPKFVFTGHSSGGKTFSRMLPVHPVEVGEVATAIAAFTGTEVVNGHTLPAFVKGNIHELVLTKKQHKLIAERFFNNIYGAISPEDGVIANTAFLEYSKCYAIHTI